ncbi:MAG: hypothetical protein M3P49_16520 [Actinomycetota bacterium]|nr:hypothetical protein [Actinomycetota bacterium]
MELKFLERLFERFVEIETETPVGNLNALFLVLLGAAVLVQGGKLLFDFLRLALYAVERALEYRSKTNAGETFTAKDPPKSDSNVKVVLVLAAFGMACPASLAAAGY